MNRILQMLQLQQELNNSTNGLNWEYGTTKNGKIIDWRRCIYLEVGELIDSYPWKHWKDIGANPDYQNIKIEIVDIWHFVMSELLRLYKVKGLGGIEDIASKITTSRKFEQFAQAEPTSNLNYYQQIDVIEGILRAIFCKKENVGALINSFLKICIGLNLKLPELYKLYIGKNVLNRFRQEHGYKDGSYIKIWSGEEDNVVMQKILDGNAQITPSELYAQLEQRYLSK